MRCVSPRLGDAIVQCGKDNQITYRDSHSLTFSIITESPTKSLLASNKRRACGVDEGRGGGLELE